MQGSTPTYYLTDGLGSTAQLADGAGAVTGAYTYDAFGSVRTHTGASTQWTFTGEQNDPNGLEYLRARYYDPAIGRFVGRDPWPGLLGYPQSLNRYPYVVNNPALFVDPYGLWNPIKAVKDTAGDFVQCAGNGFDCVGDAMQSVGDRLDDLGYVDVNATVCLGVCLSGGLQASFGEGLHPYVGSGLGLQASVSATVAPGQHITTGWNCGLQVTPGEVISPTFQGGTAGYHFKEGQFRQTVFGEAGATVGIGFPATYTCVYIF